MALENGRAILAPVIWCSKQTHTGRLGWWKMFTGKSFTTGSPVWGFDVVSPGRGVRRWMEMICERGVDTGCISELVTCGFLHLTKQMHNHL